MATFLNSPTTPKPGHRSYLDDDISQHHEANLSGAIRLDQLSGPDDSIAAESLGVHRRSSKSTRPSRTSVSKSQLRQTNRTLIEIIHNVQAELAAQKQVMLDMQMRIVQLESASQRQAQGLPPRHTVAGHHRRSQVRRSDGATREAQKRWDVFHKEVDKLGPRVSGGEFSKSPTRFSSFNLKFDLLETVPKSSRPPPAVDDVPDLSPDERLGAYTPGQRRISPTTTQTKIKDPAIMYHEAVNDIREHVIEFDKIRMPAPPKLQSPPQSLRSKLTSMYIRNDEITALPQISAVPTSDVRNSHRSFVSLRSLLLYKTSVKSQKSDYSQSDHRSSSSSLHF